MEMHLTVRVVVQLLRDVKFTQVSVLSFVRYADCLVDERLVRLVFLLISTRTFFKHSVKSPDQIARSVLFIIP